uniref:Uncharacterized protein n=1 Tax=Lutzomyia longipalpis TaxID=7200 RepID=A0A1B0C881_LUTLO
MQEELLITSGQVREHGGLALEFLFLYQLARDRLAVATNARAMAVRIPWGTTWKPGGALPSSLLHSDVSQHDVQA